MKKKGKKSRFASRNFVTLREQITNWRNILYNIRTSCVHYSFRSHARRKRVIGVLRDIYARSTLRTCRSGWLEVIKRLCTEPGSAPWALREYVPRKEEEKRKKSLEDSIVYQKPDSTKLPPRALFGIEIFRVINFRVSINPAPFASFARLN